ncbi:MULTISPECIES: zinc dependent phospholipase C family protein [Bacillus]|uniref:zinc dependent phospholipase C family protein n=1 Tax=Bacillus TaxID=1386 RepID=UPI000F8740FD|nr:MULTISPECIES: zinc dependent phospholipase C family protein [Bacillus]MBR0640323.1 zinc dependent phospholipase C family protein [Bacillus safensis]MBU5206327.1 zinc dependent phospholipase C family protein [Bacillus safensis]RUK51191.1 hypothetical protein ELP67_01410 [Bacillus safensis]
MPGPIVHLLVQSELSNYLSDYSPEYSKLLKEDKCSPYTGFGSIGPDFLFFSMKEYGKGPQKFINFYFKIYDALEPLIKFYEDNIKPAKEKIDEINNWVDEKAFHGLLQEMRQTVSTLISGALITLPSELSRHLDFFDTMRPKIQEGASENKWYWFDTLHYRRSGTFCSNMWKIAQGDNDLKRYCLGYASHIGTDVVGHPFVNAIVGGPYRTHWHRHKLVENWIDAYTRKHYSEHMDSMFRSCLNISEKEDNYRLDSISGSYLYRLCEFEDGKLPSKLGNMFISALNTTFKDIPHPREINIEDLDSTYRLWLCWFKRSTSIGAAVKPDPVDPPGGKAKELYKDYLKGLPSYPGKNSGDGGGRFNLKKLFKSISDFLEYLLEFLLYTIDWAIKHMIDIITLGYWEGIQLLRYLLYQIHKAMYEFYDNYRFSLVLGGYLFPEKNDLNKHPWGKAFINTSFVDLTGAGKATFENYPRKQDYHSPFNPEHHLIYPNAFEEHPYAEPAPIPFYGEFPEYFIHKARQNEGVQHLYDCIAPYGEGVQYTHYIDKKTWEGDQLGSAIQCSGELIIKRMGNLPNFNLDGDRGYGWKTWRANDPENIDKLNTVDVTYFD